MPEIPQIGVVYTTHIAFERGNESNFYNTRVVAFVTRHGESVLDRPVLNASSAELMLTDIESLSPSGFSLASVYPQPAVASARALLSLPRSETVHAAVYDMLGRERVLLRDGELEPGTHTLAIQTAALENGMYLLRVQAGKDAVSTPLLVLH